MGSLHLDEDRNGANCAKDRNFSPSPLHIFSPSHSFRVSAIASTINNGDHFSSFFRSFRSFRSFLKSFRSLLQVLLLCLRHRQLVVQQGQVPRRPVLPSWPPDGNAGEGAV